MKTSVDKIPFFLHDLGQAELDSVAQVLKGPILTTGDTVKQFEESFAEYMQAGYAVGVTSCTGALHLSLVALGIGPGDEVITTPLTFIATATSIIEAGATPVFVDVEPNTGNIDAGKIEAAITSKTRAIIPVHLYGQMCDMSAIKRIADKHKLHIIEDAAHCIEGSRDGVRVGELSDTACFSFYATKNLTCGEGGAVSTNNEELAQKLKLLRSHGMTKTAADRQREGYTHWDMVLMGWKYNMDNIQAALLLPQLNRIESNWQKRQTVASWYDELLAEHLPLLKYPKTLDGVKHARHLFPVWVAADRRDSLINELQAAGISVVVNYRAIHLLTYFRETYGFQPGQFPVAEALGDACISLPFYPGMTKEQVRRVVDTLKGCLD
ncbi:MAG: DegT/DnrJ/EryC1/StrS family aminotransferase [Candidatus Melainabacteria bacterium]|nr:DegT/DnrJ/EryC1/StrS family aminotransferase [Candidatus Melainabacteria bacterium]